MFTSWSDMSTPPELSTASVLMRPPRRQYSSRALLREAEVAALAHHARPHLAAVDAHAVVGAVADVGVVLARGLHVGADAAVVEQVHLLVRMRRIDLLARGAVALDVEQLAYLGRERDRLRRAVEDRRRPR